MLAALSPCVRHLPVFANVIPARLASSANHPACRPYRMSSQKRVADMDWGMSTVRLLERQNPDGVVWESAARLDLAQPLSPDPASGVCHKETGIARRSDSHIRSGTHYSDSHTRSGSHYSDTHKHLGTNCRWDPDSGPDLNANNLSARQPN